MILSEQNEEDQTLHNSTEKPPGETVLGPANKMNYLIAK